MDIRERRPIQVRIRRMRDQGQYDPRANIIYFSSDNVLGAAAGRAVAVHECTHAGFDVARVRQPVGMHDEMACMIAECWYLLGVKAEIPVELQPLADAAARLRMRPGAGLTEPEIAALYPAMRGLRYTWHGTSGFDPYNGVRI